MFKYISEILGKFTQGQRILALIIVLFSIISVTLGPSIISTNDCKDIYDELEKQRTELLRLNGQIIEVQTNCTNERLAREREIANILNIIEDEMKNLERESSMMSNESKMVVLNPTDSSKSLPAPIYIPTRKLDFHKVMDNIHNLQDMVGKDN